MSEPATNNNQNKRARFDPNVQTITDSPPFGETPTQALQSLTSSSFESLQICQIKTTGEMPRHFTEKI